MYWIRRIVNPLIYYSNSNITVYKNQHSRSQFDVQVVEESITVINLITKPLSGLSLMSKDNLSFEALWNFFPCASAHWRACQYFNPLLYLRFLTDLADWLVTDFVLDSITVKTTRKVHVTLSTKSRVSEWERS